MMEEDGIALYLSESPFVSAHMLNESDHPLVTQSDLLVLKSEPEPSFAPGFIEQRAPRQHPVVYLPLLLEVEPCLCAAESCPEVEVPVWYGEHEVERAMLPTAGMPTQAGQPLIELVDLDEITEAGNADLWVEDEFLLSHAPPIWQSEAAADSPSEYEPTCAVDTPVGVALAPVALPFTLRAYALAPPDAETDRAEKSGSFHPMGRELPHTFFLSKAAY